MEEEINIITSLTDKEITVIRYICDGFMSREIGTKMGYGLRYIEDIRNSIYKKTKTANVARLVIFAIQTGIYEI